MIRISYVLTLKIALLLYIVCTLLFSCRSPSSDLNGLYQLEGTWQFSSNTYETWGLAENGMLEGHSFRLEKGDTVHLESMQIFSR